MCAFNFLKRIAVTVAIWHRASRLVYLNDEVLAKWSLQSPGAIAGSESVIQMIYVRLYQKSRLWLSMVRRPAALDNHINISRLADSTSQTTNSVLRSAKMADVQKICAFVPGDEKFWHF